jgi:hypothetical protein
MTMPRLMSVAFTEQAVRDRTKTVTRRKGWTFLAPGDRITLCRKVTARRPGEPLVRVAAQRIQPSDEVTRIEWVYLEEDRTVHA